MTPKQYRFRGKCDVADKFAREVRSRIMSKVKRANTGPEKKVRSLLHAMGFRFRINVANLPGTPDIVLPKYGAIIFVHGCFWHHHRKCQNAATPVTNTEFWQSKFSRNQRRDKKNIQALKKLGWKPFVVWECELKDLDRLQKKLKKRLMAMGNPSNIL